MQNSIFDAISVVAEAKVKSYKADQTVECTITDVSHSSDGRYRVAYTGSEFDAYGAANSYYAGDVVYVTVPQGDFTKQKIIIGRKVDPDSLPSTTFNFKMPFDDFIALRNLTGEAPVTWSGQSVGFTANKEGRYITQTDYARVQAGTVNIDECKSCVYIESAHRWEDANGNTLTEDQVKYIAGDGEEIAINKDYVNKLKDIQTALNTLAQNYSKKLQTLQNNHKNLITLIEDVNYIFKEVEDSSGTHQVRDHIKVISTGEAMGSSAYTISWGGQQTNYLRAIQNAIITDFSIAPNKMDWVTKTDASTALWTKIRDQILLPYMRAFIAGQYTKQVEEIDNNADLTDEEKKARKAILVNANSNSSYEKLLPYFAWDSVDLEGIENTIQGRYDVIAKYLEDEFYTGMVNGAQVTYTDPYYRNLYPATVSGYASASAAYNDELNQLNAENRNLLWTWQGKNTKNILIETKLGISIDMTSLLGSWEPTSGQYGLRFVISGVTKTTEDDASQAIEETITFTNNDMYGNTYAYYTPYTQQKIFDISHLLTLDRIDCYFWQDFDFRDWGGVLIPPTYETVDEQGQIVNRFVDPNLLVSNLKVLVGLTADEAITDRVLIYTYDDTAFGLSQEMQADLGTQGVERWKAGEQVRTEDPKSNDAAKTIQIAWIHIDEQDGPILINHETMKHAADKQALQYWKAKVYWYKFDWEYDLNNGIEADRMGGQSWRPLNQNPAVEHPSTNSESVIVQSWHEAHPDFDYTYSTENENLDILVENDFTYLNQKYRAVVVANNKPYRSEVLTFINRDATAKGGLNTKLSSVILRFLKGKVTEDGSNYVIEEDLGGGNFFIYDENNNAVTDNAGTPYSQVPYFVQIWTRNRETSDYQPASNDIHFGITDIIWKSFGNLSMIANFQEPSNADLENSALTPITGEVTAEQISWIKQITRKFYVKDRWDLACMDNTIKVNMKYQGEPFTCEHECMFGNMGTMGSEYTVVISQEQPKNSPMILGNDFEVVARVYKRGIEQPDSSYFFGWEVLSPTWLTTPGSNSPAPKTKLFNDPSYDVHYLDDIGTFWNNSYDTDSTEGYQRNVFKARILNDMPLILRCTVSHVVGYDLKVVRGFSLVNDEYFGRNLTVYCPNRVEYKSDGSAPIVDMGTFQVEKNYQQTENLDGTRLFMPSDKKKKFYTNASGQLLNANGQVVQKEEDAAVVHDPISDDFIHPHWDLYAYTWALDGDEEYEEITDETTGNKVRRKIRVKPHGGPNPETDGSAGLMAGLSLQRTIGDGSEEEYDPAKHGDIVTTESGDECLGHEFDRRIVTSDGKIYVTSKYIDYKFSPVSNKTSEGAEVDGLEYPSFWSTTGRPYKGPASWHWDPAYATKYYMFITWTKDVTAPASYNPQTKKYAYHRKFWFRQAIPLTQNLYSSSLLNSWDGSLLIDEKNNAILTQMIAAGTKNKEDNTFSGVVMGDWAKKGDSSLDVPGMYGLNRGEQVFGLRINGTGYIGKSGKGRIIFDGNHGMIKNADGTCYLNLDPIIVKYKEGDLGERVSTSDIAIDNYNGTSQFFLYAETNATTDTAGTEAGNFAWAETIMRYAFGEEKHDGITQDGKLVTRTNAKDIFVVDPSNGVLTTGGIYARYGRIGKYLLLNDAGISYMEGDTVDNKYFTTTYNLTNSENNNIIYIGQERRRNGTLIEDNDNNRLYDWNYWSAKTYETGGIGDSGKEQYHDDSNSNLFESGQKYGRYIIWAGSKNNGINSYPKFGVEHDGTVHLTQAFVSGEIHASRLIIGDEDYNEADRNRSLKSFVTNITKESDLIGSNPALLKQGIPGETPDYLVSKKHGQSENFYGDGLRPGDTWLIMDESQKEVNIFKDLKDQTGEELIGEELFKEYFGIDEESKQEYSTHTLTKSSSGIDANGQLYTFSIDPESGHVLYTGYIGNQYVENKDVTQLEEAINQSNIEIASKKNNFTDQKVTTQNQRELMLSHRAIMDEKQQIMADWKIKLEKDHNNSDYQNQYNSAKAIYEYASNIYSTSKSEYDSALSVQRALENEIATLVKQNQMLQAEYHCIYGGMVFWSDAINDPSTNGTQNIPVNPLTESNYNTARLIADKINNQKLESTTASYDVLKTTKTNDDTITNAALTIGTNTSLTQFVWVGGQPNENNHHIWRGQWVIENWEEDEDWSEDKKQAVKQPEGVNAGDWIDDKNYLNETNVTPLKISKKLSNNVVVTHYRTPPGWKRVGAVDSSSPYDLLSNATKTLNRTLHSLADKLSSDLASKVNLIMKLTSQTQEDILKQIIKQRNDYANTLANTQQEVLNTVYQSASAIRQGIDPISFFTDGNCYVYLTKDPVETAEVGTVHAGLSIIQLPDQANDGIGSAFYLTSKRMGFYRTLKDIKYGDKTIEMTIPLLTYYNGSMSLAGSLFFGLDYTNFIKTHQLNETDLNFFLNEDGTVRDNVIDKDHFAYTNGETTIYKNYLDGPNSRIVLGNGTIILDGLDNGFDVDGNENSWNPGTGKRGQQESGKPYVYIGYSGVAGNDGVIRIGKKDGQGLVAIADYDFKSTSVSEQTITFPKVGESSTEVDGGHAFEITSAVDPENIKELFPNMTQNLPSNKITVVSITGYQLFWGLSTGGTSAVQVPTKWNGNGSSVTNVFYNPEDGKLYGNYDIGTIIGEEIGEEGQIVPDPIFSTLLYYSKDGTKTELTYVDFISKMNVAESTGAGTSTTTMGDFTITYSYKYSNQNVGDSSVRFSGDVLKILQHTTGSGTSGIGITASNADTDNGYVVFSPYNSGLKFNGYNTDYNQTLYWLTGWNFKGNNIFGNNVYVTESIYARKNILIYNSKDNSYHYVATHKWTYEAIADFMDGPIKKLAQDISAAMKKAREAYNQAAKAVKVELTGGPGIYTNIKVTITKLNGQSLISQTAQQVCSKSHDHQVICSHSGGTLTFNVTSASVNSAHTTDTIATDTTNTLTKLSDTAIYDVAGAKHTLKIALEDAVDARFEEGWGRVTATQLPESKKIQIKTPKNNIHDYDADKIYNKGYIDGYKAAQNALSVTITHPSNGNGGTATATGTITAKTQGEYSTTAITKTDTFTISYTSGSAGSASLKWGDTGDSVYRRYETSTESTYVKAVLSGGSSSSLTYSDK